MADRAGVTQVMIQAWLVRGQRGKAMKEAAVVFMGVVAAAEQEQEGRMP